MRKTLAVVIALLFVCAMHMPAYADVGSDVAALKDQVKDLKKQNKELDDVRGLVDKLTKRIDDLEDENASTMDYARSLEKKLQSREVAAPAGAPIIPLVESVPTRGASTSNRTFLSDLGQTRIGMAASGFLAHTESSQGHENDMGAGSFNVFMETPIGENAMFHLNLEGIGGDWNTFYMPNSSLNEDAGSLQSADGIDRIQVREAKVQGSFLDNNELTLYAGKIDPSSYFDGNEFANNETKQFVGSVFVNNPTFTSVTEGRYVPGAGLIYELDGVHEMLEGTQIQAAVFSRDDDGNHIFDSAMGIVEIDYATEIMDLPGNYRGYVYFAGTEGTFDSNKIQAAWDDNAFDDDIAVGWGLSADQYISERIGLFVRYGRNGDDLAQGHFSRASDTVVVRNAIVRDSISFGIHVENPLLVAGVDRPDDVLGLAFGIVDLYDLEDENADEIGDRAFRQIEEEYLLELYHKIQVNKHVSATPFMQYMQDVGGDDNEDALFVFGIRGTLEY